MTRSRSHRWGERSWAQTQALHLRAQRLSHKPAPPPLTGEQSDPRRGSVASSWVFTYDDDDNAEKT